MFDSRFLLSCLICLNFAFPAMADQFVWSDANADFLLNIPDNWSKTSARFSDDMVVFEAPGAQNFASCRVRVRDDHRFDIYPGVYDASVSKATVNREFWDEYMAGYSGHRLNVFNSEAGLGEAYASRIDMTFIDEHADKVLKRGFAFAGLHQGQVYVFECSSDYNMFDGYYSVFLNILSSFRMNSKDDFDMQGDYRSFMHDETLIIHNHDTLLDYAF